MIYIGKSSRYLRKIQDIRNDVIQALVLKKAFCATFLNTMIKILNKQDRG